MECCFGQFQLPEFTTGWVEAHIIAEHGNKESNCETNVSTKEKTPQKHECIARLVPVYLGWP